jgi:xanthine dehydrogenase molybdenum-binding subunit
MIMNQDGSIQLFTGDTEIGQGADTVFAQMAAATVGLRFEDVHVVSTQDTDVHPFGTGAYGSRQTYVVGMAIRKTGLLLKEKILRCASEQTGAPAETLDVREGNVVDKETGEVLMTVAELAEAVLYTMSHAEQLAAESSNECTSNAYSFGCAFAEVEVDVPLCKVRVVDSVDVHDCGRLINPALAEAQVHGGMSMSIGYGLGEELKYDEKTGAPLNNNLLDYKLSTALDHPHLEAQFVENPEPTSPFGTKALGEPPAVPAAAAIRNAILHATGVAVDRAPMTPQVLFARFREEGVL